MWQNIFYPPLLLTEVQDIKKKKSGLSAKRRYFLSYKDIVIIRCIRLYHDFIFLMIWYQYALNHWQLYISVRYMLIQKYFFEDLWEFFLIIPTGQHFQGTRKEQITSFPSFVNSFSVSYFFLKTQHSINLQVSKSCFKIMSVLKYKIISL